MIKLLLVGIIVACVSLLFYIFPVIRVCGDSMLPTLFDGELLWGRRVFRKSKCKVGCIYVYTPPYDAKEERFVIKRLVDSFESRYYFLGDNPDCSYDSRYYGYVDSNNVIAYVKERGAKNGTQAN